VPSGHLVTDPSLPPLPPPTAGNGDIAYYRRRIDELVDVRLRSIEDAIRSLDARTDTIDRRLTLIFGGLAVISVIANLLGPALIEAFLGTR
jgi:hypothetical protein